MIRPVFLLRLALERLEKSQLGLFGAPKIGGSGRAHVKTHVRHGAHGLEVVREHDRHIATPAHAAHPTETPPGTEATPTEAGNTGSAPEVRASEPAATPPSIQASEPPADHGLQDGGARQAQGGLEPDEAGPPLEEEKREPVAVASQEEAELVRDMGGSADVIEDAAPEEQFDQAFMTVSRHNVDKIRAKAESVGLEVTFSDVGYESVLATWHPDGYDLNGPFYTQATKQHARKVAEGLQHVTISAPKHEERVVGIGKIADGVGGVARTFTNVRGSNSEVPYFTKARVLDFDFGRCDECGKKIGRTTSFIVKHPDGRTTQIGGQCAANLDLAGKLKRQLAAFQELHTYIGREHGEDEGGGRGKEAAYPPGRLIAAIEWSRRSFGYVTKKQADNDPRKVSTAESATSALASIRLLHSGGGRFKADERAELLKIEGEIATIQNNLSDTIHGEIQGFAQAEWDKVGESGDVTFANNLMTAAKHVKERHVGLVAYAVHSVRKHLDEKKEKSAKIDYVPEPHADKLHGEPAEQLAAKLGVTVAQVEKAKKTGTIPKALASKLDRYVPGVWEVEKIRVQDGDYGPTSHHDLRRVSDGAALRWSTGSPKYGSVDERFQFHDDDPMPADHRGGINYTGDGYASRRWIDQPGVGDHLEIHGASVDEKPAGKSQGRDGREYHNARKISRATVHRVAEPGAAPHVPKIPAPGAHYTSKDGTRAAHLEVLVPGKRRDLAERVHAGSSAPRKEGDPIWYRPQAALPEIGTWNQESRADNRKRQLNEVRITEEGHPEPGWGWEGVDVRPGDKPEHVHPAFRAKLLEKGSAMKVVGIIGTGPDGKPRAYPLLKAMPPGIVPGMRPPAPGAGAGGMPKPGAAPQGPPPAIPPSKRVKFRHPETGEERSGTVHSGAEKGVTVVDEETGQAHRVPHGHYVAHPDADGPGGKAPKPGAPSGGLGASAGGNGKPAEPPTEEEGLQHADEVADQERKFGRLHKTAKGLPAYRKKARADLKLGLDSHAAHTAAAGLLASHTGRPAHHLKAEQVEAEGKKVKIKRTPHQEEEVKDPHLAAFVGAAKKGRKPGDPMFAGKDSRGQLKPVGADHVDDHLQAHAGGATLEDLSRYHATREHVEGGKGGGRSPDHVDAKMAAAMKDHGVRAPDQPPEDDGEGHDDRERSFLGALEGAEEADPNGVKGVPEGAEPDPEEQQP